jgi:hypothetical protein
MSKSYLIFWVPNYWRCPLDTFFKKVPYEKTLIYSGLQDDKKMVAKTNRSAR